MPTTTSTGGDGFDHRFRIRLGEHQGTAVAGLLARGVAQARTPVPEALQSTYKRYVPFEGKGADSLVAPLLTLAVQRWAGTTLGQLTVADLNAWYVELSFPAQGKGLSRVDLKRLHNLFWMTLTCDAFEAAVGEPLVRAGLHLIPAWNAGNPAAIGGVGTPGGLGYALGDTVLSALGRHGDQASVAKSLPLVKSSGVWLTATRAFLVPEDVDAPGAAWHIPRDQITGVHLHRHLKLLHQFSVVFTDGSKAGFLCVSKMPGLALQESLGTV